MNNYTFRYQHLMHLTDNELHNWLMQRGKRPLEIEQIKEAIRNAKASKRSEEAKRVRLTRLWRDLLEPLTNEMRGVYSMKRYNKERYPNPERREALDAYDAVLVKLKKKLQRYHKAYNMTPAEKAAEMDVPNNGAHWTDWIPEHIKTAIVNAFAQIPHTFKARTKTPFERTVPKTANSKQRAKLIEQVQRERMKTEQELAVLKEVAKGEDNESIREARDYLERLADAEQAILEMTDNEVVPATWQEV